MPWTEEDGYRFERGRFEAQKVIRDEYYEQTRELLRTEGPTLKRTFLTVLVVLVSLPVVALLLVAAIAGLIAFGVHLTQ